jgi:EAL domain-containing protein (putative c-di-GMP-specific phosphodiesterase class I)
MNILRERRGGQHLTFSAGVCPVMSKNCDVSLVLTCAGLAVPKTIKLQDEIVWFDDSMKEEQVWERRIEDDMEKALENHEFQVYLQPKYSTKEEVLSAAEALVRWTHPVLGFISPGKFIPIFESNGFIVRLDRYVWEQACITLRQQIDRGLDVVPVSVNVSRLNFYNSDFMDYLLSLVKKYDIEPRLLKLEITESAYMDNPHQLIAMVRAFRGQGFPVLMDDFGSGFSSLNML